MASLQQLTLDGVRSPDLSRLLRLPLLDTLVIDGLRGVVDYRPVQRLTTLESLAIVAPRSHAAAVADLNLSRLSSLEVLEIVVQGDASAAAAYGWLPLPRLERLTVEGLWLADADLERIIERGRSLRALVFQPRSGKQLQAAREGLPGRLVHPVGEGIAPLDTVLVHDDRHHGTFSLGLDLASALHVESNYEAEELLRDELEARNEMEGVEFDTEATAVWIVSNTVDDLERVRRIATELADTRRAHG